MALKCTQLRRAQHALLSACASVFLNDSGDRLALFISAVCIFNASAAWKRCRVSLITPKTLK